MMSGNFNAAVLIGLSIIVAGCTPQGPEQVVARHDHDNDHAHVEHGTTGPHGGQLIELGRNHQYHAEVVEGDAHHSLTLHLLDHDLETLAAGAESVSLLVSAGGETLNVEFAPDDSQANAFVATDPALAGLLESGDDVTGKLRVTIDGVPYTGQWRHAHDSHDHEHQ